MLGDAIANASLRFIVFRRLYVEIIWPVQALEQRVERVLCSLWRKSAISAVEHPKPPWYGQKGDAVSLFTRGPYGREDVSRG